MAGRGRRCKFSLGDTVRLVRGRKAGEKGRVAEVDEDTATCDVVLSKSRETITAAFGFLEAVSTETPEAPEEACRTPTPDSGDSPAGGRSRKKSGKKSEQCQNCGNMYLPDSLFCRKCGHRRLSALSPASVQDRVGSALSRSPSKVRDTLSNTRLENLDERLAALEEQLSALSSQVSLILERPMGSDREGLIQLTESRLKRALQREREEVRATIDQRLEEMSACIENQVLDILQRDVAGKLLTAGNDLSVSRRSSKPEMVFKVSEPVEESYKAKPRSPEIDGTNGEAAAAAVNGSYGGSLESSPSKPRHLDAALKQARPSSAKPSTACASAPLPMPALGADIPVAPVSSAPHLVVHSAPGTQSWPEAPKAAVRGLSPPRLIGGDLHLPLQPGGAHTPTSPDAMSAIAPVNTSASHAFYDSLLTSPLDGRLGAAARGGWEWQQASLTAPALHSAAGSEPKGSCPNCGHPYMADSMSCSQCGLPFPAPGEPLLPRMSLQEAFSASRSGVSMVPSRSSSFAHAT
eukprot:TRINITY_DN97289_c0_g1_i1.p1 TRINITY_DN97289_c0_g1~~TRINITY_DN97289_c0_g1_i1.p1  ORF type:complete len:521 (+),score=85.96 TRINITY_DN97289_c0_g1_i1:40-1602(+)